jgi:hypothetical protein
MAMADELHEFNPRMVRTGIIVCKYEVRNTKYELRGGFWFLVYGFWFFKPQLSFTVNKLCASLRHLRSLRFALLNAKAAKTQRRKRKEWF